MKKEFSSDEIERIIRMAWEDRTAFEAIEFQFGLTQNQTIHLMRKHLDKRAFARWRIRSIEHSDLKNEQRSGIIDKRFKCSRQSVDGVTKGWK